MLLYITVSSRRKTAKTLPLVNIVNCRYLYYDMYHVKDYNAKCVPVHVDIPHLYKAIDLSSCRFDTLRPHVCHGNRLFTFTSFA